MAISFLMRFIFPSPSSIYINAISVISFASLANLGFSEIRGKHLQYSKFWNSGSRKSSTKQIQLSSRTGMLIAYAPAFLVGVLSFVLFPTEDFRVNLLKSALTLHFFKRNFEVIFVHKYSSKMVLDSAIPISLSYFSSTATMIYAQHLSQALPEPPIDLKYAGIVLYFIGITGNFYHHFLLSKTRREGEKEYKIPNGGLFGLVICPHYLYEIIEFIGFSFTAQTTYSFTFTLGTVLYLLGRSCATRKWYVTKFEDFPKHIKALVPFIF